MTTLDKRLQELEKAASPNGWPKSMFIRFISPGFLGTQTVRAKCQDRTWDREDGDDGTAFEDRVRIEAERMAPEAGKSMVTIFGYGPHELDLCPATSDLGPSDSRRTRF